MGKEKALNIPVVRKVLEVNERIAEENRRLFDEKRMLVLNLMSSPGAGKTTLLETTIDRLKDRWTIGVIEGDLQTTADAERIACHGVRAVQINTEGGCHLDGNMVRAALDRMDLEGLDLLVIENVGNLVCPAEFELGEHEKVVILSVTEGDDKPAKYPTVFRIAGVLLVNKIDLLPYVKCDVNVIRETSLQVNPDLRILEVSAATGEGIEGWIQWLEDRLARLRRGD
jgi:hydrogenase nickel incorporation protein HypB